MRLIDFCKKHGFEQYYNKRTKKYHWEDKQKHKLIPVGTGYDFYDKSTFIVHCNFIDEVDRMLKKKKKKK